jgi:hypothetical protein
MTPSEDAGEYGENAATEYTEVAAAREGEYSIPAHIPPVRRRPAGGSFGSVPVGESHETSASGDDQMPAMTHTDATKITTAPSAPKMTQPDATKITATLPNEVVEDLRQLAKDRHLTLTAALREAITTSKFINDETRDGKLLIEKDNGDLRQIVFR